MKSELKIRLNVCKSWSCPNLGVADAIDYVYPVHRLGYPALECAKCGSLPPLFNENECNIWFAHFLAQKLGATGQACPRCYNGNTIRYGHTRAGSVRLQCCACQKVFTPGQATALHREKIRQFLKQLSEGSHCGENAGYRTLAKAEVWCNQRLHEPGETVKHIATETFVLPFQGKSADQRLYVVFSTDASSGRILQITTNYCDWEAGESLRYKDTVNLRVGRVGRSVPERVREQEAQFMRRRQFDDIRYGSAHLKQNDTGNIVRPVIAIHGHFQWLKRRFPETEDHYLAHECVLRGAAITAWAPEVRAGLTHLWFVVEEATDTPSSDDIFQHKGTWRMGWWDNAWQRWDNGRVNKMIGMLSGQKSVSEPGKVSLSTCEAFIVWLQNHPWAQNSRHLSARVIGLQLVCLAYLYNKVEITKKCQS